MSSSTSVPKGKGPAPPASKHRNPGGGLKKEWCFTKHLMPAEERLVNRFEKHIQASAEGVEINLAYTEWPLDEPAFHWPCSYLVAQLERCPDTGKLHWQGFMVAEKALTLVGMKRDFDNAAHWEPRMGTVQQAIDYCKKPESRVLRGCPHTEIEYGVPPEELQKGRRTDLEQLAQRIVEGASMRTVAEANPAEYIRYFKGMQALQAVTLKPRSNPPEVTIIWGPPGCGKTRAVFDEYPEAYFKDDSTKWWDGYQGQDVVLIDEFTGETPLKMLLRILDRYPFQGEVKGAYINISATKIFIASMIDPRDWYKEADDVRNIGALWRRVRVIYQNIAGVWGSHEFLPMDNRPGDWPYGVINRKDFAPPKVMPIVLRTPGIPEEYSMIQSMNFYASLDETERVRKAIAQSKEDHEYHHRRHPSAHHAVFNCRPPAETDAPVPIDLGAKRRRIDPAIPAPRPQSERLDLSAQDVVPATPTPVLEQGPRAAAAIPEGVRRQLQEWAEALECAEGLSAEQDE